MPMRSESSNSPARVFTVAKTGSASSTVSMPDGRHRSQTGFRSGPLNEDERRSLENLHLKSSDTVSYASQLEADTRDLRNWSSLPHYQRVWPVNDRDYTETRYSPTGTNISFQLSGYPYTNWANFSAQGAMGVSGILAGALPTLPADSSIESMAARMLRNSRPPEKLFDLARFIGEQREAPLLWKLMTTVPTNKKELAGSLLGTWFGLQPTGSDLGNLAELVLRSERPVLGFLNQEKVREKKYGTRVLLKDQGSGEQVVTSYSNTASGTEFWTGLHKVRLVYPGYSGTSSSYANVLHPILRWDYTRKQILRTFATWEYFVPQPTDFRGRLSSYRKKAELLLSSTSLKESTVWELTPWTWLSDWFVDIGGLLRYQQAVRDNHIVASAAGYSVWEEFRGTTHFAGFKERSNIGVYPYFGVRNLSFTPYKTSVLQRRHKRRSANPYSISPSWNLSTQQWTILTTLGLAKGGDQPSIRR